MAVNDKRTLIYNRVLWLALGLGLLLRLPGWFTPDEKRRFLLFEPDEIQHVDVALDRYHSLVGTTPQTEIAPIYNVRGYGILSGHLLYVGHLLGAESPNVAGVVLLNRVLSTVFGLLLIGVVYGLGRRLGLGTYYAGAAALLLAFCDLHCTYSHYGIPASGYVLGVYLVVLGLVDWRSSKLSGFAYLTVGTAVAFAFKFDFLPLFVTGLFLTYTAIRGRGRGAVLALLLGLPAWLLLVGGITGFSWSPAQMWDSWSTLRAANQDVVASDDHWFTNPFAYGMAVVAAVGGIATSLAIIGLKKMPPNTLGRRPELGFVALLLLLEFVLRWSLDTPFVRRANVFLPAVILLAAYALKSYRKPWLTGLALGYTLALGLLGQSNHWFDTRQRAHDWLLGHVSPEKTVAAVPYTTVIGGYPTQDYNPELDWDYALLHDAYTARYWRDMINPIGPPECCAEVYHCRGETMCRSIQELLAGERDGVELVVRFRNRRWLPERWLYYQLFGPYDTFSGDARIYRKRP